jgi:hypothetical protein
MNTDTVLNIKVDKGCYHTSALQILVFKITVLQKGQKKCLETSLVIRSLIKVRILEDTELLGRDLTV